MQDKAGNQGERMEVPWFTGAQWWLGAEMNELGEERRNNAYFTGMRPGKDARLNFDIMSEESDTSQSPNGNNLFSGTEFRRVVEKPLSRPRRKNRKYPNRKIQILHLSHKFWLCEKSPSFDFIPLSFALLSACDFDWLVLVFKNPAPPLAALNLWASGVGWGKILSKYFQPQHSRSTNLYVGKPSIGILS